MNRIDLVTPRLLPGKASLQNVDIPRLQASPRGQASRDAHGATDRLHSTQEIDGRVLVGLTAGIDLIALSILFVLSSALYHHFVLNLEFDILSYFLGSVLLAALSTGLMLANSGYALSVLENYPDALRAALINFLVAFAIFVCAMFLSRAVDFYSRAVFILQFAFGALWLVGARYQTCGLLQSARRNGRVKARRIFLVGSDEAVVDYMREFKPWADGISLVGVFRLPIDATADASALREETLREETLREIEASVRANAPDDVVLILPWTAHDAIELLCRRLSVVPTCIHLAPSRLLSWFQEPVITQVGSTTTLQLMRSPLSEVDQLVKRIFDILGAVTLLIVFAPVFLAVAFAIKRDTPGPVIFRQQRHGFNQKPFRVFKFRTMSTLDDGDRIRQATRDDARVTRVGRFLRASNLDELPQLVNVLRGEMSLVGPRPHALAHNREFEEQIALYARRHNVVPGITGWAQVNGFRGITDTPDKMRKRVEFDLYYIDNWSLWLDVQILFLTIVSRKAYRNAV